MSTPWKIIFPSVGSISRRSVRPRVLFPQPLSPTIPKDSPLPIVRSTPSTAFTTLCFLRKKSWALPVLPKKYFFRPCTSSKGDAWELKPSTPRLPSPEDRAPCGVHSLNPILQILFPTCRRPSLSRTADKSGIRPGDGLDSASLPKWTGFFSFDR